MTRYRWDHDRTFSDGMCGRVTVVDPETGRSESQHWSVTDPEAQSQHEAYELAHARLERDRIDYPDPERR